MDSTFSLLGFLIFGISISFYAIIVQSQALDGSTGVDSTFQSYMESISPPPPPPTPPLSPPSPSSPEISLSPTGSALPPENGIIWYSFGRHHISFPSPPPPPHKMNAGKKVGLLFVGIAAIMQVGLVGFLVIKRRQLLKSHDNRFENCS